MRTTFVFCMMMFLGGVAHAQAQEVPSRTEEVLYHASQMTLLGGWALDEWMTVKAIGDPIHVNYLYCEDGSQTCQFPMPVEKTVTFREVGWASWYGIQEPYSVVAASIALDAGILTASHFLYKRGGIWRKIAIGLNFAQAGSHLYAGFGTVSKLKSARIGLVPAGAFSIRW